MTDTPDAPLATALEVLTDAELAVLDGWDAPVAAPFLDPLDDVARDVALQTAYRGLLARGIVEAPTAQAVADADAGGTVDLPVREDVAAIVEARSAPAVLSVARTTADGQDLWYAHVHAEVVLLEQVDTDGVHRFAVAASADLPVLLVDAAVHPGTGDGTGEPVLVTDPTDPSPGVLDALGLAAVRADVVLRTLGDDRPTLTGVFTGPQGAWTLTTPIDEPGAVLAQPRSRDALHALLHDLVRTALTAASAQPATPDVGEA